MAKKSGKGYRLDWKGDIVAADAEKLIAQAWTKVGLAVEGEAKKQLYKGTKESPHGVKTGTLRRSIHIAQPGYQWSGDNVEPSDSTPERGGQSVEPVKKNGKLTLQVGSGMVYALFIELGGEVESAMSGGNPFVGYRYLRGGLARVKPRVMSIVKTFFASKFKKKSK